MIFLTQFLIANSNLKSKKLQYAGIQSRKELQIYVIAFKLNTDKGETSRTKSDAKMYKKGHKLLQFKRISLLDSVELCPVRYF